MSKWTQRHRQRSSCNETLLKNAHGPQELNNSQQLLPIWGEASNEDLLSSFLGKKISKSQRRQGFMPIGEDKPMICLLAKKVISHHMSHAKVF